MKCLVVSFLFFLPMTVIAQATGSIRGHIRDRTTGEDILFAKVYLMPADTSVERGIVGTYTDENGNYELRGVSPGTYRLCFRFDGMQDLDVKKLLVEPGQVIFQNAEMETLPLEVW